MISRLMGELVMFVQQEWERVSKDGEPDIHHYLCTVAADRFDLARGDRAFPLWLCRVVEGVMRDMAEGEREV